MPVRRGAFRRAPCWGRCRCRWPRRKWPLTLAQPTPLGQTAWRLATRSAFPSQRSPWPYRTATPSLRRAARWAGLAANRPTGRQATGSSFAGRPATPAAPVDRPRPRTCAASTPLSTPTASWRSLGGNAQAGALAPSAVAQRRADFDRITDDVSAAAGDGGAGRRRHPGAVDRRRRRSGQRAYVYWLQTVAGDDATRDVAFTTLRAELHQAFSPRLIAR